MQHDLFIKGTIFIASLVLFPLILPGVSPAAVIMEEPKPFSAGQVLEQIAAESAQDTLKACLGRIPLDASIGQLMLAEQSCQQAEVDRTGTALTF
jgi:predicted aconitase with swiveling domain